MTADLHGPVEGGPLAPTLRIPKGQAMDTLAALPHGRRSPPRPQFPLAAVGVTIGTAIGALPGLGPSTTVALLMPLTYNVHPTAAFIMFAGIYYGSQYGGSTASILLNTRASRAQ